MELYKGRLIAYSLGNFGGYEVFALNGALGDEHVLQVTLAPDGTLQRGRIRPTELVGAGTPAPGRRGDLARERRCPGRTSAPGRRASARTASFRPPSG